MGGTKLQTGGRGGEDSGVQPAAIRAQVQRMLSSKVLVQSHILSRFLTYIVERAIAGETHINEYAIGIDVFGRSEAFDPRIDPIVRVHARRLRQKLRQFYQHSGASDPIEIELPVRTYVPVIRERPFTVTGGMAAPDWTYSPPAKNSLAVPAFASLSSEQEGEYFAAGLRDELVHALANLRDLRVVTWTAARREAQTDIHALGRRLNVQAVLDGTVRKMDGQWRISAQLTSVADGSVLWSEMYTTEPRDAVAAQEKIARSVCDRLRMRIETLARYFNARGTAVPEAHAAYLKARYQCNKWTWEGLDKCIHLLVQALALAPDYAAAHCALSEAFILKVLSGQASPGELMPQAREEARRALECDPTQANGYVNLGIVSAVYEWDMPGAEAQFTRALGIAPNLPNALQWYGLCCLLPAGRFNEAAVQLARARDLDPLCLPTPNFRAYALYSAGRPEEALAELQQALDLEPMFPLTRCNLGVVYERLARWGPAIAELIKARELSCNTTFALGSLGHAYAASGQSAEARARLNELLEAARKTYVSEWEVALVYAGLGAQREALEWLDRGCQQRCAWLLWLNVDPRMQPLRSVAQFQSIVRSIGL